jgi:quercetin dioxygenase-like cupin family protein
MPNANRNANPKTEAHASSPNQAKTASEIAHPSLIRPGDHAVYRTDRMGKSTLFHSPRLLVGLNAFEPGQEHRLHAHQGMDKVYQVVSGRGLFLLEDADLEMSAGDLLVAPEGVPHGIRNTGEEKLLVLAILGPAPPVKS